ncbi:MAG: hypothetical protein ABI688_00950 [Bacteroidota bacterium]
MQKQKAGSPPISQRDLAAYPGISSLLLSMTISGRHGARQLGAVPSKKMENLLLAHQQSPKSNGWSPVFQKLQDQLANDCRRLAKVILMDADHADAHVTILRSRLNEIARNEQQDRQWFNTVNMLLSTLPKSIGLF